MGRCELQLILLLRHFLRGRGGGVSSGLPHGQYLFGGVLTRRSLFGPDGMPCVVLWRPEALDCRVLIPPEA